MVFLGSIAVVEREFGKFDKAIRHATSVTLDITTKEFEEMSQMALDASVKWNKAASDTAFAFYFLGSAGLTATEQMQAFNDVVMLSRAMGSNLATTVEGLVDIVRAFGLEFADTTNIADQLTKTIVTSNQMFQDLDQALSYASSTARLTNNTLAETNAMLGIMANAGIKGCYDDQTEVLTHKGWLKWSSVTPDDAFATMNPNTGFIEYQKPSRLIRYHHKGKMYHVANRGIDLCVTPNHRMWVKQRDHDNYCVVTAEEVDGKNIRYKAGGLHWNGDDPSHHILDGFVQNRGSWIKKVPSLKIDAELWATFLGWYISEGSCDYRKGCYRTRITQNSGIIRDKMRIVLNKLPVTVNEDKNGFIINDEQIWRDVKPLGKTPQKYIPQYALDWSPRLLNILLNTLMEGDGDCNECYYTSSKRLADNVTEIVLKLGYAASLVLKTPAGTLANYDKENREIRAKHDQWKVSVRRKLLEPSYYPSDYTSVHGDRLDGSKFPNKSEWIDYDGEVFCAEVPNHLLIVRRNGKILVSGNSMAGTVLRRAMTNLMSPTAAMSSLMYELGLEVYDATGLMKPFIDVIGEISDKLVGSSDAYRNMVFEVLFGRRAIAGQITLFNYGSVALRRYATEIKTAGGTTERVASKQMRAFTEVLGQLFREAQRVSIELGSILAPSIEQVANTIRHNLETFKAYIKTNRDAIMSIMKWTTAISVLLVVGGPLLLIITSLVSKMVALALVIANPFIILIASLYTLRAVWKQTSDEMKQSMKETAQTHAESILDRLTGWGAARLPEYAREGFLEGARARRERPPGYGVFSLGKFGTGVVAQKEPALTFKEIWSEAISATTKQMKADFGAGFGFVAEGLDDMDGLVGKLVAGFKEYTAGIKGLFDVFMRETYWLEQVERDYDAVNVLLGKIRARLNELDTEVKTTGENIGFMAGQWKIAMDRMFGTIDIEIKQWADSFETAMLSIQSSWADTIEKFISEGGSFLDFMESMFQGILRAFNRMIAEVIAGDLMFALFGGKRERGIGAPSLWDLLFAKPRYYTPGLRTYPPPSGLGMMEPGGVYTPGSEFARKPALGVEINITNKGVPVNLNVTGKQFDGKRWVISAVMDEMHTNPAFAKTVRGG
ncbi:MAG: phage tail tape measure protein [Candidatus Bathyarchaeota archaeon]|nr:phage tail tape measure protein [Candidatus Bathyarchaeota archaeon]